MEHLDEHEMLVEYSEMTAFDFNSKEFQKVKKDYLECKNFVSNIIWRLSELFSRLSAAGNY